MSLEEYRKKRKFDQTPEPLGRVRTKNRENPIFVVQKHDATNLHYDFRLEIEGNLTSWAVPKGPSLNPADKRLAIMTEDHPMEYADFEGLIPEGHYGAGVVMLWDRGTYELSEPFPAAEQLIRGELKVVLHGTKLRGGFVLIHSGERSSSPTGRKRWLLIKQRDDQVDVNWDIQDAALGVSVLTGRTLKEIANGRPAKDRVAGHSGPIR